MGFLNGLVNDMLKESVGYDVGKITRMVGGKNLLMLGAGAALAGSLAGQGGPSDGPSSWAEPPRAGGAGLPPTPGSAPASPSPGLPPTPGLPPVPGAAPPVPGVQAPASGPPPLPPVPGAPVPATPPEPEEISIPEELTYGIVRTMVSAALADGHLDPAEKDLILKRLDSSGLSPERIQQVHRDLVIPPGPTELAALTDSADQREAMYRFAGLILLTDGNLSDLERTWLDGLATAFGFDGERKAALETEIFAD